MELVASPGAREQTTPKLPVGQVECAFPSAQGRPVRALTQQQAVTVIWMVLRPGWHTCFRHSGLWEVLLSPRSMVSGVALTLTCTEAGQLVFICRSSWW